MSRRSSAIAKLRSEDPAALLLDAGNALVGADSIVSGGKIIVGAYNALGYDALNLSYRDFRLGKTQTITTLKDAAFAVLSATLIDDASGVLLAKPYVVITRGARRIAIVGATEMPAGMADLPHIRSQLAGIRMRPVLEALAEWLPRAKAESDLVILLYYGSAAGLDAICQQHGDRLAAILVGGLRPNDLPSSGTPPVVATGEHGQQIAYVRLIADGGAAVNQIDIGEMFEPDPRMLSILKRFQKAE